MSTQTFHEIYLHLNWHTGDDLPLLTPAWEAMLYDLVRRYCRDTPGLYLHEVGGTPTHLHLALNMEPSVTLSRAIDQLKGYVSHEANADTRDWMLAWQRGYAVVSFAKNQLAWVCAYIRDQQEHPGDAFGAAGVRGRGAARERARLKPRGGEAGWKPAGGREREPLSTS